MVRDEYAEFIWEEEQYKCHVDEFVDRTRASLLEAGEERSDACAEQRRLLDAFMKQYKNCYLCVDARLRGQRRQRRTIRIARS